MELMIWPGILACRDLHDRSTSMLAESRVRRPHFICRQRRATGPCLRISLCLCTCTSTLRLHLRRGGKFDSLALSNFPWTGINPST